MTLTDECDHCGSYEERVFRDSWTGKELCLMCLAPIINRVNSTPSEIDNLDELLASVDR